MVTEKREMESREGEINKGLYMCVLKKMTAKFSLNSACLKQFS